jgi:hypothetical protein
MKYFIYTILLSTTSAVAQTKILLQNKSFEDHLIIWLNSYIRYGWDDCELFPEESPPDLHTNEHRSPFGVNKKASDQHNFVGMAVRDNETNEAIVQRLREPMEAGKCYKLSLDVAVSEIYLSKSRKTLEDANYTEPCILRVWGNENGCQYDQLLAKTKVIDNNEWKKITFKFVPDDNYRFIMIEDYWDEDKLENGHYCGHILIDNLSDIEEIDCTEKFNTNY